MTGCQKLPRCVALWRNDAHTKFKEDRIISVYKIDVCISERGQTEDVLIYCLYNDVVSISDSTASNGRMIN
jgi:hypothetical protein